MLTLDRVVRREARPLDKIMLPSKGLERVGFGFVRGQVGMIVASPGTGKSVVALELALANPDLRTLYVSADTDQTTMAIRAIARGSGHPQSYVEQVLKGSYYDEGVQFALHEAGHIQWSFDSYTSADIRDDCLAGETLWGAPYELVVVDNLMNIARGGADELSAQSRAMDDLHALAQTTGAHVLVLHHANGAYDDGDKAIPLSGIANKLSKLPANILTLYRRDDFLHLCVVKNRQGRHDPSGNLQVRLRADLERMQLTDPEAL
jgi:hypothetical protein